MLGTPQPVSAMDKVTLLDGKVLSGHLEEEDALYYYFRVVLAEGKVNYLQRISRKHVKKLELGEKVLKVPGAAESGGISSEEEGKKTYQIKDKKAYLESILSEWEVRNIEEASFRLVRLINQSSAEELLELEEITRKKLEQSLPAFAAEVHMAYSLQRVRGGYFRLYFVMPFHVRDLRNLLVKELRQAVREEVALQSPEGEEKALGQADSIEKWLDRITQYDGYGEKAIQFSKQITKTIGLNRELVRLCQILKRSGQEVQALNEQRDQLRKLLLVVNARKEKPPPAH